MLIVPPSGNLSAALAIVGARPGKDECSSGKPFSGPSGSYLWNSIPYARDEVYVTNVRRDWSATNAVPTKTEIHEALPALRDELAACSANCILALGNEALYALTGKWGIDKWRGSILESTLLPGRKVVAAWHPANVARTYNRIWIFDADVKRAINESRYPEIRRPHREFILDPTQEEAIEFIRAIGDNCVVDIECPFGSGNVLYCMGVSDAAIPHRVCTVPFIGGRISPYQLIQVIREFDELFRTRGISGQNIGFDVDRLERFGFRVGTIEFDTMLAHHLLWPEAGTAQKDDTGKDVFSGGHDLGFIASCYTTEPYYKHEAEWKFDEHGQVDWRRYWTYNAKDVAVTGESRLGLLAELREFGQEGYYREHVLSLIRPVWRMQSRGLHVDLGRLVGTRKRLQLETDLLQARFNHDSRVGFHCNVKSPIDMKVLILEHLGLKINKKSKKTGAPSLDEDTIRELAYNSPHTDLFQQVIDIRKRRTLISGFLGMEVNDVGNYCAGYKIHGTDSGRLSSTSPKLLDGRMGPQLQNIPKKMRIVFNAPQDYCLMTADLRRAEAMYVAYAAREEALIDVFNDSTRDLYRELAADALGRALEDISKDSLERECFKSVCHASNYGMGDARFIKVLRLKGIDIEDIYVRGITQPSRKAKFLLETYHQKFPNVRRTYQAEVRDRVRTTRTLHDAFGRRRFFMGRMDDALFRIAFSFPPQGTVVGITNAALRQLDGEGWPVVLQVHDSVGMYVRNDQVERGREAFRRAFNRPLVVGGRELLIPIDIQEGPSWGEVKSVVAA